MRHIILIAFAVLLAGCASMGNIDQSKIAQVTHADLQSAAKYATDHGFPARAAVWTAIDVQLKACNDAITANEQTAPQAHGFATAFEVAAESVGTGIPSAVKLNCAPLPLIVFPKLP